MNRRLRFLLLAFLAAAWLVLPQAVSAATVLHLNLEELAAKADRIFAGTCTAGQTGEDPSGFPATWYTFTVTDGIKGTLGATITIKQWGIEGVQAGGRISRIPGVPTYRVGEQVMLFLAANSQYGFTSPVGLLQGKFRVIHRRSRQVRIINGLGNANLFTGMTPPAQLSPQVRKLFDVKQGPLEYVAFTTLVRGLATRR